MIKILVIDDEEAILEIVKRGLEKEGFAADTLTSARRWMLVNCGNIIC